MPATDVALVRPPYRLTDFDEVTQEALGLGMVAASMRAAGLDVVLIDAELEELGVDDVLFRLADLQPAVVGMTVIGRGSLASALDVAKGVKRWAAPDAHVTLGGMLASFAAAEILNIAPAVDSVVMFEGEVGGTALAHAVIGRRSWRDTPGLAFRDGETMRVNPHAAATALDDLPWAARDLLPLALESGHACSMLSSRGCVGSCTFCSAHSFNRASGRRGWTGRQAMSLVDELESLRDQYGLREVVFVDDDFIGDAEGGRSRALAVAEQLRSRDLDLWFQIETRPDLVEQDLFEMLHAAGLRSVFMGIESVSPRAQAVFGKRLSRRRVERALAICADLDLVVHTGYIMFSPYGDLDEIEASFAFLRRAGQANPYSLTNALHAAPGTALLPRLQSDGMVRGDPVLGFSVGFRDDAVARLHTMALLAVRALFPSWYRLVRLRAATLTELHGSPSAAASHRRSAVDRAIEAIDDIAGVVFEQALQCVRAGESDVVCRALELREGALTAAARVEAAVAVTRNRDRPVADAAAGPSRVEEVGRVS